MTTTERNAIRRLAACTFLPASWDKRFVKALAQAEAVAPDKPLTLKQAEWLEKLTHKYRRQHGRCACLECLKGLPGASADRSLFQEREVE